MRLVVTSEARFATAADGSVWTKTPYHCGFWSRYLSEFDRVRVVARAAFDAEIDSSYKPVTGANVEFFTLPFYLGPRQFFLRRRAIRRTLATAVGNEDALLCRVGSPIAGELLSTLEPSRPYALEVVGDPDQALAPGTVKHPLRPLFRWVSTRALQRQAAKATGVAYVTRDSLQKMYPTGVRAFSTHYSSIALSANDFGAEPRRYGAERPGPARLIFVGSLAQMYKGADVLLHAFKTLTLEVDAFLTVVGDGKHRGELEALARALGVDNRVRFLGELASGELVRDELDRADLFVLPSRSEGLPRAMIEAMARALPCIGAKVGGIPELLSDDEMVPANDPAALASLLKRTLQSAENLMAMSLRNLSRAQEYRPELLARRRNEFYRLLRHATERWNVAQGRAVRPTGTPEAERISA